MAREKARGAKDDAERNKIMTDIQPTLKDLEHYYNELKKMDLSETEIEQLIQII